MLGFVAILAVSLMRVGLCGYFSCQSDALGGGGGGGGGGARPPY